MRRVCTVPSQYHCTRVAFLKMIKLQSLEDAIGLHAYKGLVYPISCQNL